MRFIRTVSTLLVPITEKILTDTLSIITLISIRVACIAYKLESGQKNSQRSACAVYSQFVMYFSTTFS